MSSFPCLVRLVSGSGQVRYRLGDRLVDRYLEFVAGQCRPNTVRAVAFDLKAFFAWSAKDPVEVAAADVFEFLADQRGDRAVVRMADRESGLSARTIARRLSSVSGFYAYLVARGDTPVRANPVPRGLPTRRHGGRADADGAVGAGAATLPRILRAGRGRPAARGVAHAAGSGDGAGDAAGRAASLRGARPAARGSAARRVAGVRRPRARAGINGWCRCRRLLRTRRRLHAQRAARRVRATDRVFVVLKGPRPRSSRCRPTGLDEILTGARHRAGLAHGTCHELRHTCLTRLREAGMSLEALQPRPGTARSRPPGSTCTSASTGWPSEYRRAAEADRGPRPRSADAGDEAALSCAPCRQGGAGQRPAGGQHRRRGVGAPAVTAPQVVADDAPVPGAAGRLLAPRTVDARRRGRAAPVRRWLVTEAQITAVANIRRE